jgi:hypothetical protein
MVVITKYWITKYFIPEFDIQPYELAIIVASFCGSILAAPKHGVRFSDEQWDSLSPSVQRHFKDTKE